MAATQTVPRQSPHCNSATIIPTHGVVTLFGYGIKVHVDRGHLVFNDGIGMNRRHGRFARVRHGFEKTGSDRFEREW